MIVCASVLGVFAGKLSVLTISMVLRECWYFSLVFPSMVMFMILDLLTEADFLAKDRISDED